MNRKTHIVVLLVILALVTFLFAEKTKERLANEKGVEGEDYFNAGQFLECGAAMEEAIQMFQEAVVEDSIPADPEKIYLWYNIAFSAYIQANALEKALKIENERIKISPDELELYSTKAILLKNLERIDEALEVYKYIDSIKPDDENCNKIAKIYQDREDWDNALIWYNKSYELKQDSKTIQNIAVINLRLGRTEEAIKAYEDFLQKDIPQAARIRTYKNLGRLYEDLNDTPKAIKYYEKLLELKYDPQIGLLMIDKYYEMKSYDKCLEKIAVYLKNKPGNSDALYYRAQIKYDRGDKVGARADFVTISSDPRFKATAQGFIESIDSE
ncbi:MAG: tetratricopeptide repeat protein [Candidatus Cloacimonetes bacterium]|nr:tetratricopeptide repeat protein [Candidatus Cloacimonadota bacterium]